MLWVVVDLLPKLPKRSVLVMDNATFHKRNAIQKAITDDSHTLEYVPSYSPDMNPIENKWPEVKAQRRRHRCDDIDELFKKHVS